MFRYIAYVILPTVTSLAGNTISAATVVVPPGVAEVEGDERTGTLQFSTGLRIQEVYPASEFHDLDMKGNMIVSMRMRPDQTTPSPNLFTDDMYELRLSTTPSEPGTLSATFSENRGDDEAVVYRGPIRWETTGPTVGGPSTFEYVVEFSEPFTFDPRDGRNLLVEEVFSENNQGILYHDSQTTAENLIRRQFGLGVNAETASFPFAEAAVRQFEFVPEPSSSVLCRFAFAIAFAFRRRRRGH